MNQFTNLSQKDLADLMGIIAACSSCASEREFTQIILDLQALVSFDCATVAYVNPQAYFAGNEDAATLFDHHYPPVLLERYFEYKRYDSDIQLHAFYKTGELQNWNDAIEQYNDGVPGIVDLECREYGLADGWLYGVGNLNSASLELVSLSGAHIENDERTRIIVPVAIIHLCECYKKLIRIPKISALHLTPREIEVLHWLKEGKTSWEISIILSISERSSNFHINNLKEKLNAVNRAHAVATALILGVIPI